jgi:hypothetical protein
MGTCHCRELWQHEAAYRSNHVTTLSTYRTTGFERSGYAMKYTKHIGVTFPVGCNASSAPTVRHKRPNSKASPWHPSKSSFVLYQFAHLSRSKCSIAECVIYRDGFSRCGTWPPGLNKELRFFHYSKQAI